MNKCIPKKAFKEVDKDSTHENCDAQEREYFSRLAALSLRMQPPHLNEGRKSADSWTCKCQCRTATEVKQRVEFRAGRLPSNGPRQRNDEMAVRLAVAGSLVG